MAQSNVPNSIAMLDDVRWKLAQSLKLLSEALEEVLRIQLGDSFKPPLSDQPIGEKCICAIAPTNCCAVHAAPGVR